jgi:23S rRNA (cytosine1962-C5)-methyltransferase
MTSPVSEFRVNGYSERWLRRGFPWVYPKEVVSGKPRAGTEVRVRAPNGDLLGRGIADEGWIAARIFRADDGPVDASWVVAQLERAMAHRLSVVDGRTDGYRLVNAENDGLPGVRVDRWGPRAVITLDSPSVGRLVETIAEWLMLSLPLDGVHLCYRPDSRDTIDIARARPPGLIAGSPAPATIRVRERGLSFWIHPTEGPDVGLYADMREVRAWLEPHWKGRRVLNTFAFTGAFSVAAAANGSKSVLSVDLSERALERAKANFELNGLEVAADAFVVEDTFKTLDRLRRKEQTFDLVILDPPSFSHGPAGTWSALQDTPRLVASACRVLAPDGWLVACSNLGELSPHKFTGEVEEGLRKAGRRAQEIWRGGQAPDFPAASWFPEGRYLKVGIWRVF